LEDKEFGAGRSKVIDQFLHDRLSERHFKFWMDYTSQFPLPFHRPSSSTGKYHLDKDGKGHTIEEHTLELLQFIDKTAVVFGDSKKEQNYDILLLAAALHDCQKYGVACQRTHTDKEHGSITARGILKVGTSFGLSEMESKMLSRLVEIHSGRWSTCPVDIMEFHPLELYIHIADFSSSRRILKFD